MVVPVVEEIEEADEGLPARYFFKPARARAPAGSTMDLVSRKTSLIAAQISSVETWTTSSTHSRHRRYVSSPRTLTAAPSANKPTSWSIMRFFWASDCASAFASCVSTPMTLTCGAIRLMYTPTPAIRPPPPTEQKTAWSCEMLHWRSSSIAIVPWPAITYGSSKGWIFVSPCLTSRRLHSSFASSKSCPNNTTLPPSRDTFRCLISGEQTGITIVAGIRKCFAL